MIVLCSAMYRCSVKIIYYIGGRDEEEGREMCPMVGGSVTVDVQEWS
jgi:hypothetical protein